MQQFIDQWLLDPTVGKMIASAFAVLVVIALARMVNKFSSRYIEATDSRYRIRKIINFFGYILVVLLLSTIYSDKLGSLTVFLGVAGAGVAFALQEVIASAAGWVTLSFGRFYNVGDRVQLGGIRGDVIDIGILRTTLMECGGWINGDLYNGRIVRVANSYIFKEPVFNYSSDFPFLWDEIVIPVRYGSRYEVVRNKFQKILEDQTLEYAVHLKSQWRKMTNQYMLESATLEPMVTLKMTDNWAEFTLRYVTDYKQRRTTRDKICAQLLQYVDASPDEVKLGASTFEVASVSPFDVNVNVHKTDLPS